MVCPVGRIGKACEEKNLDLGFAQLDFRSIAE